MKTELIKCTKRAWPGNFKTTASKSLNPITKNLISGKMCVCIFTPHRFHISSNKNLQTFLLLKMEYYVMTRFQNLQFLKSEQTLEKKHFNH